MQDCLSAAWQRIDTFDKRSSLITWLIGIMKFKVIDHFRKSKRTPTDQAVEPIEGDQAGDTLDSMFNASGASCRSAFCLCSEQMDRELTKGESIRLRAHLMMCGLCRRIPAQFDGLRSLVQACEHQDSHEEVSEASMTPEAKQRIF